MSLFRVSCFVFVFDVILVILLMSLKDSCLACNPGRGGIRMRGSRKLTPLVFKQHVPNYGEYSLAASGRIQGPISRSSEKFRHLTVNYNVDVIFKDEEGTGADRIMTQRCKEQINTLAISVMNQWPGLRLRVTEAWDEDLIHMVSSLHYEGRAVDITTSDKDRRKYGLLARLAVEAGFDWVFYESRSHIHASCKSEPLKPSRMGGCFSSNTTVLTSTGERKKVSDLHIGDYVLSTDTATNTVTFSPVILFLDRDPNEWRLFYTIHTESGHVLSLTPTHLLYMLDHRHNLEIISNSFKIAFASEVSEGDWILVLSSRGTVKHSKILKIEVNTFQGVYAPLTATGNILADNVLASCYAFVDSHNLAHAVFSPLRWWNSFLLFTFGLDSHHPKAGIHWYANAMYTIADYIMPNHFSSPP